ncbi:MAG: bacteriophage holin [Halorientalis sp.]
MSHDTDGVNARALALAVGVLWAGAVTVLGITSRIGWGDRWRSLLADVYVGYDETITGTLIGAVWAFVDGFTGGYLLAWLYNKFD